MLLDSYLSLYEKIVTTINNHTHAALTEGPFIAVRGADPSNPRSSLSTSLKLLDDVFALSK
jgi:hypothetical protein